MIFKIDKGESGPVFIASLGNSVVAALSEQSPQKACQLALSRPEDIVEVLSGTIRKCHALFNRLCCEKEAESFWRSSNWSKMT